jgi:hypothetical protein
VRVRIADIACLVRSKNAGPFWLTFDVLVDDDELYSKIRASHLFDAETIAPLFRQRPEDVQVFAVDAARAFKVSFPRPQSSGSPLDPDVFGGQQYAPLLDLEIDI